MSSKERQQHQQLLARGESLPLLLRLDETSSSSRGVKLIDAKKKSFFSSFVGGGKGKGKDDANKKTILFVAGCSALVATCSLLVLQASRHHSVGRLLGATTYYENPVYLDNNTNPMSEPSVNDIETSKMTLTLHTGCSPHEKLPWAIEDKKTWGDEVGAKIIFKTDSNDFFFERGVEMDNAGCGSYSVETDELLVGTQFGFALYQKNNVTTSHHATKDIGCRSESGSDPRCPSWKSPHGGEGQDGDGVRGGPMEMTECTFQYKYGDVTFYNRVFDGETTDYVWGSCLDTCPSFTRTPYCGDADEVPHMGKVEVREDEKCVPGEYLQANGKCQKCPVGHYSEEARATECQPCAAGTMQPHEGQTECIACPYGWYQSEIGQQYCESCPGSRADSSRRKLQGGMMDKFKSFDWSKFGSLDGWEWIQNTTETIVNKTETAYDDAINAVNNTLTSGADAVKQTAKKTTDAVSSAFSKTKETAEDSKDAVDKVAENAKEKADDAMNDAQTSATSAVNDAKESAESASEDVKEAAKETKDNVEKATEDPKEVVEDGVNGVKKATVSAEEAAEDAAKEAKDNVEKATEDPKEVVEDGVNGVKKATVSAEDAAKETKDNVEKATEDPKQAVDDAVNGVKKATVSAEEAAEDAANASKESVEDAAEKVKSGFDGSNSQEEVNSNGSESSSNSDVESTTTTTTTKQEQEENEKQESSGPIEDATPSPSSSSSSTSSTISTTSVTSTTTTTPPTTTTTTTYATTTATTSDKRGATSLAQCPASPSFEEEEVEDDQQQQQVGQIGEEEKTETTAPKTASSYRRGFHQTNSKPRSWAV